MAGATLAGSLSAGLTAALGITLDDYSRLWQLTVACTTIRLCTVLCVGLVPLRNPSALEAESEALQAGDGVRQLSDPVIVLLFHDLRVHLRALESSSCSTAHAKSRRSLRAGCDDVRRLVVTNVLGAASIDLWKRYTFGRQEVARPLRRLSDCPCRRCPAARRGCRPRASACNLTAVSLHATVCLPNILKSRNHTAGVSASSSDQDYAPPSVQTRAVCRQRTRSQ